MSPVASLNPSRTALPFPRGRRLQHDLHVRTPLIGLDQFAAAVGRIAFDDDDLLAHARKLLGEQRIHHGLKRRPLIEHGHDNRHEAFGSCWSRGCGHDRSAGRQPELTASKPLRQEAAHRLDAAQPRDCFGVAMHALAERVERIAAAFRTEPDVLKIRRQHEQVQRFTREVPEVGGLPLVPVSAHQACLSAVKQWYAEQERGPRREVLADLQQGGPRVRDPHQGF